MTVLLTLSRPPPSGGGSEQSFALPTIGFHGEALSQVCSLGVSVASQLRVKSAPAGISWQRFESSNSVSDSGENPAGSETPLWEQHPLWGLAHFHGLPPVGQLVVEGLVPRVRMRLDLPGRSIAGSTTNRFCGFGSRSACRKSPRSSDVSFSCTRFRRSWKWTDSDGRPVAVQPVPVSGVAMPAGHLASVLFSKSTRLP